jgi:hypothetical protein
MNGVNSEARFMKIWIPKGPYSRFRPISSINKLFFHFSLVKIMSFATNYYAIACN